MSKKIQDENGNTFVEVKPLYKRWWIWVLAVVVIIFIFAALSGGSDDTKESNATAHTTTSAEKGNSKNRTDNSNSLTIDYNKVPIISEKTYKLSVSDTTWNSASVSISSTRVIKVKPFEYNSESGKKAEGLIILNVAVKPSRDLTATFPDQGTIITNDGQQQEAIMPSMKGVTTNWGGDIANGANKSGDVIFPLEKLNNISDIKSLRYKFNASYDTDDYEDENSNHNYDLTINLD